MATEVVNDPSMNRYELLVDGASAGFADYQVRDNTIVFIHTEIDPAIGTPGLDAELVHGALNLVRAETDYRVVAHCPFTAAWINENPGYQELLSR